eukprot:TRINITY_DN12431_c0_g1_i1.p1 TRINITY_DN12431_c0_g1~~TRINITY_DN12431_c0_g1_i1.p1  ORF type:complete len:197 (+),score=42.77 TRINITY_DN12431_c0_g1_i1:32-622(+)
MNYHQANFPLLQIDLKNLSKVIECIVHSIIFIRSSGLVTPTTAIFDSDLLTYVKISDLKTLQLIETQISQLVHSISSTFNHDPMNNTFQTCISLCEIKPRLFRSPNISKFEEWNFSFEIVTEEFYSNLYFDFIENVKNLLFKIIETASLQIYHLPKLGDNTKAFSYHLKLNVRNFGHKSSGLIRDVKNVIKRKEST